MEKRSRRPHGIRTRKISVSVTDDDLAVLTERAKREHRGNISAVVHELVDRLRREAALDSLLVQIGADSVTAKDLAKLRAEIAGAPVGRRRRGKAA